MSLKLLAMRHLSNLLIIILLIIYYFIIFIIKKITYYLNILYGLKMKLEIQIIF